MAWLPDMAWMRLTIPRSLERPEVERAKGRKVVDGGLERPGPTIFMEGLEGRGRGSKALGGGGRGIKAFVGRFGHAFRGAPVSAWYYVLHIL